jgi:3-deoxy-D-manno-octulosonate 8-phosphate phosphatase (KDO 8-P phosphatase)
MTIPSVSELNPQLVHRLSRIRAFLLDVDGVLTATGSAGTNGLEDRVINMMDADSIRAVQRIGVRVGILTTEANEFLLDRARELDITDIYHGTFDKAHAYTDFKKQYRLEDEDIAFMGDGVLDLSVLKCVGFATTPANGHVTAKMAAHYVSRYRGGYGAVREVLTMLVRVQTGDESM